MKEKKRERKKEKSAIKKFFKKSVALLTAISITSVSSVFYASAETETLYVESSNNPFVRIESGVQGRLDHKLPGEIKLPPNTEIEVIAGERGSYKIKIPEKIELLWRRDSDADIQDMGEIELTELINKDTTNNLYVIIYSQTTFNIRDRILPLMFNIRGDVTKRPEVVFRGAYQYAFLGTGDSRILTLDTILSTDDINPLPSFAIENNGVTSFTIDFTSALLTDEEVNEGIKNYSTYVEPATENVISILQGTNNNTLSARLDTETDALEKAKGTTNTEGDSTEATGGDN